MKNNKISTTTKGFTLMELMIVIVILGILASLILGNFFTSLKRGRDARRKADIEQVQRALELYYDDKRAYPTAAAAGGGFVFGNIFCDSLPPPAAPCPTTQKVYMQKVSNDPSVGKDYKYVSDGTYWQLYACLENTDQVLPYQSNSASYDPITCGDCQYPSRTNVKCIWGISSTNTTP